MAGFGSLYPGDVNAMLPEAAPPRDDAIIASIKGMASLPRRAIENSQRSGDYDPATSIETALITMGGTPLGATARAGEMALGAGPYHALLDHAKGEQRLVKSPDVVASYHDLLEPPSQLAYNALHGYPEKVPAASIGEAAGDVGGGMAGAPAGDAGAVAKAYPPEWSGKILGPNATGEDLHYWLSERGRGPELAAKDLKAQGIPGIRYMDERSRTAADKIKSLTAQLATMKKGMTRDESGTFSRPSTPADISAVEQSLAALQGRKLTHNYVTFDAPRILKKYAAPGVIGAGGFGSLAPGQEQ